MKKSTATNRLRDSRQRFDFHHVTSSSPLHFSVVGSSDWLSRQPGGTLTFWRTACCVQRLCRTRCGTSGALHRIGGPVHTALLRMPQLCGRKGRQSPHDVSPGVWPMMGLGDEKARWGLCKVSPPRHSGQSIAFRQHLFGDDCHQRCLYTFPSVLL